MSPSALKQELKALGFVMCLKTRELRADGLEANVCIGYPKRWGIENNVYCVYDEFGHPWVTPDPSDGGLFRVKVLRLVQHFGLQLGCPVCHCHDGGDFIRRQYPVLKQRQLQSAGV